MPEGDVVWFTARRLREQPARAVGEALLDQTRLAGIGNIYKAEVLFLRGVNPWTRVEDVPGLEVSWSCRTGSWTPTRRGTATSPPVT